ncbi:hypothetical protein AB0L40_15950 [Patulibacter sp. NPDC049589]|uniref:hypothetical protein n=1 Tax=Patulibacter sp. NPDC049589 TaxID=3154731 RepID=UPI0034346FED
MRVPPLPLTTTPAAPSAPSFADPGGPSSADPGAPPTAVRGPGRRRLRTVAVAVLACTGALSTVGAASAAGPPATPAPAPRTVLDAAVPISVSVQGARVAWLRPKGKLNKDGSYRLAEAVVLDAPGSTPRTLTAKLPTYPLAVSLGTDAANHPVLLVTGAEGIYVVRADGQGRPTRLRGQNRNDDAAVMRGGRTAFTRVSGGHTRVRTATAAGRPSRVLYTVPDEYSSVALALGAKGAVALHASRARDVGIGDIVWLLRPGKKVVRLTSQSTGGASDNGLGALTSSGDGSRFGVSRWNFGGGHPRDVQRFSAASGRRTFVRPATVVPSADALDELLLDDGRSVITPVLSGECVAPGVDPAKQPGPPCLGLDLVG